MSKKFLCLFAALILLALSGCAKEQKWTSGSASVTAKGGKADAALFAMDTYMSLTVYSEDAYALAVSASERIAELEALFDPSLESSEVSRLNKSGTLSIGKELITQIETARIIKERSNGALDLTVGALVELWGFGNNPKVPVAESVENAVSLCGEIIIDGTEATLPVGAKLNLGSCAKGYTSNELARWLRDENVESALISLGGNVQVVGSKPDGSAWRVAVQDPRNESQNIGVLSVKDVAVVTSGDYQRYFIEDGKRYCHILDPRTGMCVDNGVCAVTIICNDGLLADCLSTAMMVLGRQGALDYWKTWGGFEMLIVCDDGSAVMTPGFASVFEVSENPSYTVEVFNEK